MPKYGYLVVEGPHDIELVYRLLSPFGFKRVQLEADLDPFLNPLIPRSYPPDGDLQKRMPVPLFLQNSTHSIAVHSAVGDSRLIQTVEENAVLLDIANMTGIGVLLDADSNVAPVDRYLVIRDGLRQKGHVLPDVAGNVNMGPPRVGCFVLPDNLNPGTLENILLECAQHAYPALLTSATNHIAAAFSDSSLTPDDLRDFRKPAGRNKAIIGSIASVLRPGRAVQVSLQDNRWLREETLKLPSVQAIQEFLSLLLDLPQPSRTQNMVEKR